MDSEKARWLDNRTREACEEAVRAPQCPVLDAAHSLIVSLFGHQGSPSLEGCGIGLIWRPALDPGGH